MDPFAHTKIFTASNRDAVGHMTASQEWPGTLLTSVLSLNSVYLINMQLDSMSF